MEANFDKNINFKNIGSNPKILSNTMKNFVARIALTLLFAFVIFTFIANPSKYMGVFLDGITAWAHNVLPVLFPFALLSTLYSKGIRQGKVSLTKKLFNIPCNDTFLISILCGYPAGAKAISELDIDNNIATAMCSFCSTPSIIFIVATVGYLLQNTTAIAIICISQLVAMILNGLLYTANKKYNCVVKDRALLSFDFGSTLTNSILATLSVGALIALFFVFAEMIQSLLPTDISQHPAVFFAIGLMEMTSGILKICSSCPTFVATVCTSALLAFGGICIALQSFTFVTQKGVRLADIIKMKCTQCAFATITAFILATIFL